MTPVNKALGLNRVPQLASRILRRLDEVGFLGKPFRVAGTHALYALEQACAVQARSDLLATGDVDLLWDSSAGLKLTGGAATRMEGVLSLLQRVDRSFHLVRAGSFRAVNKEGYMVDLITPSFGDPVSSKPWRIGAQGDDLTAIEIGGLAWLVNSPSFEQTVIGEDGYPLRMITPDPRAWAIHKLWLFERDDREPVKRTRDRAQALFAIDLLRGRQPDLPFDADELGALSRSLRAAVSAAQPAAGSTGTEGADDVDGLRPNW
ncbi:nucleotidyltransferase family protein [Azospirillum doebereinerae]